MLEKKVFKLFPTLVSCYILENYEKLNNELEKYIYELRKNDPEGISRSNQGGWHSKNFKFEDSIVSKYAKLIEKNIHDVITSGYDWKYIPNKVHITEMWSIVNKKNDINHKHNHQRNHLSAAYYVRAPKNCGEIQFYEPAEIKNMWSPPINKANEFNADKMAIKPQEGLLVIFPAYLNHMVKANQSNKDRIVISFNIKID